MKNLPLLLGTLLGTILLIVGIVFFFSRSSTEQVVTDEAVLISETPQVRGPEEAPVTIVEFSDFQCPACRSVQPLVESILQNYPNQVRLVYRHFPLTSIHPNAPLAAQAAEAAAEDGKFYEYHDLLFARQEEWSEIGSQDELKERLGAYAEELSIDKASFLEKIESDHIKALVAEDVTAGSQLNVQATPTFYVNGRQTPASQLINTVESFINS